MDILDETLILLWKSLSENNVQYIMVGGFAVSMHGYNRTTDDIDIWIKDDSFNRKNLAKALLNFGYENINWDEIQFVPGWNNFSIGSGIELDILVNMKGLEGFTFEECFSMASIADIESIEIPFLHINQLILNKKAVNRTKDQLDIMELENIIKIRKEMGLD